MKVFLDDIRECPDGYVLTTNYYECIGILEKENVEEISLDHDLGCIDKTGYDVVKFMVENDIWPSIIYLHSSNPVGIHNMSQLLNHYAPTGVKIIIKSSFI